MKSLERTSSFIVNTSLLEYEHMKFQTAALDNLIFEHVDEEEERKLIFQALQNMHRGVLPKGSEHFESVMFEIKTLKMIYEIEDETVVPENDILPSKSLGERKSVFRIRPRSSIPSETFSKSKCTFITTVDYLDVDCSKGI